jgi:hypothetical protein
MSTFIALVTCLLLSFITDHSRRFLLTFNVILSLTMILFFLLSIQSTDIHDEMHRTEPTEQVFNFCSNKEISIKSVGRIIGHAMIVLLVTFVPIVTTDGIVSTVRVRTGITCAKLS